LNAAVNNKANKHIAYIGLGSNINPESNLPLAVAALNERVAILCVSSVWRAPALGTDGPDFMNAVAKIETEFSAKELKSKILRPIEAELGRVRGINKNAPRSIDLDILIFDREIKDPHIWDYAYLIVPLAECLPDLIDPVSHKSISRVSADFQQTANMRKIPLRFAW
jgi:2-amino-4-hydroxy-6-hydroxymethyldihydropteridine diphosphokinase